MRAPSQVWHGLFLNEATLVWTQPENELTWSMTVLDGLCEWRLLQNVNRHLFICCWNAKWLEIGIKDNCWASKWQKKNDVWHVKRGKDALSDTKWLSLPSIRPCRLQHIWAQAMPVNRKHLWYVSRWFTLIFWSGICQTTHPWPERSAAVLQPACSRNWSINEMPTLTLLTFDHFCVHADVFYLKIQTSCDGKWSSTDICWDVPALTAGHHLFVLSAEIE